MPILKDYFERRDVPAISGHSWIPLRQATEHQIDGLPADIVSVEEFTGVATAAVEVKMRPEVDGIGWTELSLSHHRAGMETWGYHSAEVFRTWTERPLGINLVIAQLLEHLHKEIWHLHPDLVLALGLIQEGDNWYRPEEGWAEVVRLKRASSGKPELIEIKAEFLSDYLAARGMLLFASSYVQRMAATTAHPNYGWDDGLTWQEGRDTIETMTRAARHPEPKGSFWTRGAVWRTEWVELPQRVFESEAMPNRMA